VQAQLLRELYEKEREVRKEAGKALIMTIESFGKRVHSQLTEERKVNRAPSALRDGTNRRQTRGEACSGCGPQGGSLRCPHRRGRPLRRPFYGSLTKLLRKSGKAFTRSRRSADVAARPIQCINTVQ
jgi:hypothetical protein